MQHELKRAGRAGKLPAGVVLTGGSSLIKGIDEYAKEYLGLAAKVGKSSGYGGVVDGIEKPQFATAVGLMLIDLDSNGHASGQKSSSLSKAPNFGSIISRFMNRFKA